MDTEDSAADTEDLVPSGRLRPIYLQAPDTPAADAQAKAVVFDTAITAIRAWYGEAMGPEYHRATFEVEPLVTVPSRYTRAQWEDFSTNGFLFDDDTRSTGCAMVYGAWHELVTEGGLVEAGLPAVNTPGTAYVVVTGGGTGGGCGLGGFSAVEEFLLDRIAGRCPSGSHTGLTSTCADAGGLNETDPWCQEWPHALEGYECTAVGAFAHEIGHGFELPHGADRPESTGHSIMDYWWEYDRGVTLSEEDRADLAATDFFL